MTLLDLYNFIQAGGIVAALLVFIWLSSTKRIRWGYQFDELQRYYESRESDLETERDKWRELALRGTDLAGQLSGLVPPSREVRS